MKTTKTRDGRPCARGFTLIELLVVVGSVAILAAAFLPALAGSRPRAQHMVCMNNVKQITLAGIIYSEQYGQFPPDRNPVGTPGMWEQYLSSYVAEATNIFLCPTTTQPQIQVNNRWGNAVTPWCKQDNAGTGKYYFGSYSINGWLYNPATGGYGDYGPANILPNGRTGDTGYYRTTASIKYPAKTPTFADGVWVDGWPTETDQANHNTYNAASDGNGNGNGNAHIGGEMSRYAVARHACNPFNKSNTWPIGWTTRNPPPPGAVNVGLVDGHVELSTLPGLWTYYWHNYWKPSVVLIGLY